MNSKTSVITTAIAMSGLAVSLNVAGAPQMDKGLPAAHTQHDITYLSGGVGKDEASAIKHVAKFYPLEVEFLRKATPKDEYLASVKVRIKDARDKMVLNVTSDGPFLLAKLPAGRYTVSAESDRVIKTREVDVAPDKHRRLVFEWYS